MKTILFTALIAVACATSPPERSAAPPGPSSNASLGGVPEYVAAHAALWRALEKARSEGALELYGFEELGEGEPSYRACVVFRSARGATALMADGNAHLDRMEAGRGDTVAAAEVSPAEFARLRARVGVELPFPAESRHGSHRDSPVLDGWTTRVFVVRDGRVHEAEWYAPDDGDVPGSRDAQDRYRRAAPVVALIRAVRAAMPPALFPVGDEDADEHYASRPGY